MSVIPASSDQTLVITQADGSRLHFRYMTGKRRVEFNRLQEGMSGMASAFISEAEKQLKEKGNENPDRRNVNTLAVLLAKEAGKITDETVDSRNAQMVDLFLCGWEGKDFPSFPKEKPSDMLGPQGLIEVLGIITEHFSELLGVTVDELKNSTPSL